MSNSLEETAPKIRSLLRDLGDQIEHFVVTGGQVNLRVYHNEGCESIDLHKLNGEMTVELLRVEKIGKEDE